MHLEYIQTIVSIIYIETFFLPDCQACFPPTIFLLWTPFQIWNEILGHVLVCFCLSRTTIQTIFWQEITCCFDCSADKLDKCISGGYLWCQVFFIVFTTVILFSYFLSSQSQPQLVRLFCCSNYHLNFTQHTSAVVLSNWFHSDVVPPEVMWGPALWLQAVFFLKFRQWLRRSAWLCKFWRAQECETTLNEWMWLQHIEWHRLVAVMHIVRGVRVLTSSWHSAEECDELCTCINLHSETSKKNESEEEYI